MQLKEWQRKNEARIKQERFQEALGTTAPKVQAPANFPQVCKIVYCSRTHSQLQQVAKELEKTAYSRTKCAFFQFICELPRALFVELQCALC